jgi:hypothetical protein
MSFNFGAHLKNNRIMKAFRFLLACSTFLVVHIANAQYILTLHCEQMDPYLGKRFEVRVTEIGSGKEVGRKTILEITDSEFSIELYVLLSQRSYYVDFYADVSGNGEYDVPPVDHAWRRVVNNIAGDMNVDFIPDENYTDVAFPESFPYSNYDAIWGGKWMNETFGSTDSIESAFRVTCDSVYLSFSTAGVFGNPATVAFDFADALPPNYDAVSDTIRFSPDAPWTGEVYIINGELHGDLTLMGIGLEFIGTVGLRQILSHYIVTNGGNPFANGYFYVRELQILDSSPELELQLDGLLHVSCASSSDGAIFASAVGGSIPYLFSLNGGPFTFNSTFFGLGPGVYCVILKDSEGCSVERCVTITEPAPISLSPFSLNAGCFGSCDGSITLMISGGQPPYTFNGDTGSTLIEIADLCAGEYTFTVMDAAGCLAALSQVIPEPDTLIISAEIIHATSGQSNGSLVVTVTGGTTSFQYSLDGVFYQDSSAFLSLPAGVYCVFIRDENGCMVKSDEYEIQNTSSVAELEKQFRWYPNPVSSHLVVEADILLSLKILDIHGNSLMYTGESLSHRLDLEGINPGIYVLQISDGVDTVYRKIIVLED